MRSHEKPSFSYSFKLSKERAHLASHLQLPDRAIPPRSKSNLLVATWNLTNFGLQKREKDHLHLMAEILRPFDVVAIQEVADDLSQLADLVGFLGSGWDFYYTDIAGNDERLGFIYDQSRVMPTGLAGELAMRGYERERIIVEDVETEPFEGFNRNPFMFGFAAGAFTFYLVNVHLYWSNFGIRQLEAEALGKWASGRVKKNYPPNDDIILIGDFNMPHMKPTDAIYRRLAKYGLELPAHTSDIIGTNLAGDKNYDQIAFFPGPSHSDFTGRMGVVDFDNAIYPDLYAQDETRFFRYVRYYLADHRPMWAEFRR